MHRPERLGFPQLDNRIQVSSNSVALFGSRKTACVIDPKIVVPRKPVYCITSTGTKMPVKNDYIQIPELHSLPYNQDVVLQT